MWIAHKVLKKSMEYVYLLIVKMAFRRLMVIVFLNVEWMNIMIELLESVFVKMDSIWLMECAKLVDQMNILTISLLDVFLIALIIATTIKENATAIKATIWLKEVASNVDMDQPMTHHYKNVLIFV